MCSVSVGVLGDACRALEDQIYAYCDGIMQILLSNLQSEDVQRSIKPMILACFSDVALAVNDKFEKYLPHVLTMLQSAQASIYADSFCLIDATPVPNIHCLCIPHR